MEFQKVTRIIPALMLVRMGQLNLNNRELGKLTGIDERMICNIKKGRWIPNADQSRAIEKVLQVSQRAIFDI